MFLTRIGENSKLVVNGDPSQIDLLNKSHFWINQIKKILEKIKEIKILEFDHKDVVRHPLVSKIIQAYQKVDDKKLMFLSIIRFGNLNLKTQRVI